MGIQRWAWTCILGWSRAPIKMKENELKKLTVQLKYIIPLFSGNPFLPFIAQTIQCNPLFTN